MSPSACSTSTTGSLRPEAPAASAILYYAILYYNILYYAILCCV